MNKRKISALIIAVVTVITVFFAIISVSAEYSDSDPLVTLSYINETVIPKITENVKTAITALIDERFKEFETRIPETPAEPVVPADPDTPEDTETPEEPDTPADPQVPSTPETPAVTTEDLTSLKYSVVFLQKGSKLMASGESTESLEVILRAGEVVAVSPFADQGIADLTAAKELYNGDSLVKNNYCIVPRGSDGRGIYAVDSDAYILVRGEFEIVQ